MNGYSLVQLTESHSGKLPYTLSGQPTAQFGSQWNSWFFISRIILVFSLGILSFSSSGQSWLQNETEILNALQDKEIIGLEADATRSQLPEHFTAASVRPQISSNPQVVELDEGRAAVIFFIAETGGKELELIADTRWLNPSEKIHFYNIDSPDSQAWGKSGDLFFSDKENGTIALEWNGPLDRVEEVVALSPVRNAYLHFGSYRSDDIGFGTSLECNINVLCPEGLVFSDIRDGVHRIRVVVEEGIGYCSGALINNTAEDHTPFVLTAFHCMDGNTPLYDMWRFDFFYESTSCSDPQTEPTFVSLTGSEFRAGHVETDFLLLEMTEELPSDMEVPFLGWDRREDYLPQNTALIHHPSADIKKVSLYSSNLRVHPNQIFWNNGVTTPGHSHYRQDLSSGTFEPGSSGSPLLSPEGRIMGQLHGGSSSCTQFIAYSGILYYSWDLGDNASERLKDWLDPLNTGQLTLDHSLRESQSFEVTVSGIVKTITDEPVGLVEVELNCGNESMSQVTDVDGLFNFELELTEETVCLLNLKKDTEPLNGINILDVAGMRRHILQIEDLEGYSFMAADLNGDGEINLLDILDIRRLILRITDRFTHVDSWKMIPYEIELEFSEDEDLFLEIKGLKMGDINFSADPSQ
jgi:hypothetical protein